ncbi:nicotinate-nucleotide--dimethylbenzimidazole phosphoribosyltransferase [Deltaproteobacteria bacterium]|nr:nicotinate-nucleotide--dimethylbenzimidazole phosphoribosyltransferase [Deltaproteobacteria bacterium]
MKLPNLPEWDDEAEAAARAAFVAEGALAAGLGRLGELAAWWCGATGGFPARAPGSAWLVTFVANHGVVDEGVSAVRREDSARRVALWHERRSRACVVAEERGFGRTLVEVGEDPGGGTRNIAFEAAMSRDEAARAVRVGLAEAERAIAEGAGLLGAAELAAGSSTAAAACLAVVAGMPAKLTAGRGSGIGDAALRRKIEVIDAALARGRPDRDDAIGILAAVGGLEIAAIAGFCIGAAALRVPVVLDGFASTAGGMLANVLVPGTAAWFQVGHRSAENAHWGMCRMLGKDPIHDLGLGVCDGLGAVLGMDTMRLAAAMR